MQRVDISHQMKSKSTLLASATLAVIFSLALAACGKKKEDSAENDGPQSPQGAMLEAAKKTVDQANQRSANVKKQTDKAAE